jgi:hypothetical protein
MALPCYLLLLGGPHEKKPARPMRHHVKTRYFADLVSSIFSIVLSCPFADFWGKKIFIKKVPPALSFFSQQKPSKPSFPGFVCPEPALRLRLLKTRK